MYKYLFLLLCICLVACSSGDSFEETFLEKKSQYVGSWNSIEYISEFRLDTLFNTAEITTTLILEAGGRAILDRPFLELNDTSRWFYQVDPEQLVFVDLVNGSVANSTIYDVISFNENTIELNSEYTKTSFTPPFDIYDINKDRILSRF